MEAEKQKILIVDDNLELAEMVAKLWNHIPSMNAGMERTKWSK
jgi:CheY-like chemotaxis protein